MVLVGNDQLFKNSMSSLLRKYLSGRITADNDGRDFKIEHLYRSKPYLYGHSDLRH